MGSLGHSDVVHLLVQLSVMLLTARLLGEAMRKIKLPAVVGEIIGGLLLGPTILGMINPDWFHALFPVPSSNATILSGLVQAAMVMLLFIAGLEVDLHIVWQQRRQALSTSFLGLVIPFFIGFIFPYSFPQFFGIANENELLVFALFIVTVMAIT